MPVVTVVGMEKCDFDRKYAILPVRSIPLSARKTMQERTSWTGIHTASSKHFRASSADLRAALPALQALLRPCHVGFLLLAFAVALFAFGYKTSLYQYSSHQVKHFPVAKAVVEQQRSGISPFSIHGVRRRNQKLFDVDPQNLLGDTLTSLPVFNADAPTISTPPRALPFFDSALPLRSPPSFAT
jgi:hypothetical protein